MLLYHGHRGPFCVHGGLCLADDITAALSYGEGGYITVGEFDTRGLHRREVDGYVMDDNEAPGDSPEELAAFAEEGVDYLVYEDSDLNQRDHDTIRLVSPSALQAFRPIASAPYEVVDALRDEGYFSWGQIEEEIAEEAYPVADLVEDHGLETVRAAWRVLRP